MEATTSPTGHRRAEHRSWAVPVLLGVFRAYQTARVGRVSPCRFTPTCSNYAIEAVDHHGARRGLSLAIRRLGRCRPGGPSGYDPVPK
jgi:putative membrane protein insertion efficiency factor